MFIAIVDDMPDDRKILYEFIDCYCKSKNINCEIICYKNAEEFLNDFKQNKFEIAFLDIYYSENDDTINGFELSQKIRSEDNFIKLIFTTTSVDFGIESYSVFASDYMVKPITFERLSQTLDRLNISSIQKNVINIVSNRINETIKTDNIIYIAPNGRGNSITTTDNTYFTNLTFDALCEKLKGQKAFLCCKRGYMVNMNYIADVKSNEFIMKNGQSIPIRTRNSAAVRKEYSDFIFYTLWKD